jgi:hypothetical protein
VSAIRVAASASIALSDSGVERGPDGLPVAFRMWRAGDNATAKGTHRFTQRSAELLAAEQQRQGRPFSFDVDHMSLSDKAPPDARIAVGWFQVEVRDGDLWVTSIEWGDLMKAGLRKDPPEWRFFSPAYQVEQETQEIVSLINCAITNNPATFAIPALASRAGTSTGEDTMADEDKTEGGEKDEAAAVLAAFKKMGKAAAIAAMKAAFPDDDGGKKKDEESTKASESEPDGDEGKKKDEEQSAAVAAAIAPFASRLNEVEGQLAARDKKDEQSERAAIFASRKDISPKLAAELAKLPLATMKATIAAMDPPKGHPGVPVVTPTRGSHQTGGGDERPVTNMSIHASRLDQGILGIKAATAPTGWDGDRFQMRLQTPSQARAHLKVLATRREQMVASLTPNVEK